MEDKSFLFTDELTKRMLRLRFENDRLFKSRKRPWLEFYNILLENGFPAEMTLGQVRKKWSYNWDMYKIAKREKNKGWKYYKLFDKHFGKTQELDKYDTWSKKWRLKLITCIVEAKEHNLDHQTLWRTIERAMRCQLLPEDCCVQDMQGLWHHIKMTFIRKHRIKLKRNASSSDWALYEPMLEYYGRHEPEQLVNMQAEKQSFIIIPKQNNTHNRKPGVDKNENEHEFHWSKDITESFIQIRLQNDWLFNQRIQAWKDFVVILREEHGFPNTLTSREASRKWSNTFAEYQKAKATNNKSWVYHNLFELYLGEGTLSMNPLLEWHEEWALNMIKARTSLEDFFLENTKLDPSKCWREVEKRLRSYGIPLDHSLLDLPNIWSYLIRTYKWKKKFADKGVLKEQWPYFEAMAKYLEIQEKTVKVQRQRQAKQEARDYDDVNDDFEDDMKLFELKQKMELDLKPKYEIRANQCRACANVDACVDIFEHKDEDDMDVASKLKIIGGVEVERAENFPSQICYHCLQELENAYKFRRKCQTIDKHFRDSSKNIKLEFLGKMDLGHNLVHDGDDITNADTDETVDKHFRDSSKNIKIEFIERIDHNIVHDDDDITNDDIDEMDRTEEITVNFDDISDKTNTKPKTNIVKKSTLKKKYDRRKYEYWKVCEICGVHTKNLKSHVDTHNSEKPYSCNVCDKKFKFKNGLFLHKAVHDPTPRKTCEICGKTFHVLAHYKRHFVHHANERKFECDTCGKRFNSIDILRVHNRIHTDERPFNCPECGKTFRTAGCVSRHKRIVHRITRKVQ